MHILILFNYVWTRAHSSPCNSIKILETQLKEPEIEVQQQQQQQVTVERHQNSLHSDRPQRRTAPNKTQRAAADKRQHFKSHFLPVTLQLAQNVPAVHFFLGQTTAWWWTGDKSNIFPQCKELGAFLKKVQFTILITAATKRHWVCVPWGIISADERCRTWQDAETGRGPSRSTGFLISNICSVCLRVPVQKLY